MSKPFPPTPVLTGEEVTEWMFEKGKSGFMLDYAREAQRDASDRNRDKQWEAITAPPEVLEETIQLRIEEARKRILNSWRNSAVS